MISKNGTPLPQPPPPHYKGSVGGTKESHSNYLSNKVFIFLTATPEPGEDPRVTRAKYFIRDEFLVSRGCCLLNSKSEDQTIQCLHVISLIASVTLRPCALQLGIVSA